MVRKRNAFQTLRDEGNPDYVRDNGPFECTDDNAWLHNGYYFWDEDVQLSHWWGRNRCKDSYIICKSKYQRDYLKCWDIYGEHIHRKEFIAIYKGIKSRNINSGEEITAREIIEELFRQGKMRYEAIRIVGTDSISQKDKIYESVLLEARTKRLKDNSIKIMHRLELRPPIQICFFSKNALNREEYEIIYPDHYIEEDFYF